MNTDNSDEDRIWKIAYEENLILDLTVKLDLGVVYLIFFPCMLYKQDELHWFNLASTVLH